MHTFPLILVYRETVRAPWGYLVAPTKWRRLTQLALSKKKNADQRPASRLSIEIYTLNRFTRASRVSERVSSSWAAAVICCAACDC